MLERNASPMAKGVLKVGEESLWLTAEEMEKKKKILSVPRRRLPVKLYAVSYTHLDVYKRQV